MTRCSCDSNVDVILTEKGEFECLGCGGIVVNTRGRGAKPQVFKTF